MSEKKNIVPIILSIAVHVIVIGLLVFNFAWDDEVDVKHEYVDAPINAKIVTAKELPKPDANAIKKQQEAEKKRLEEERKKQLAKEQEQKRLEVEKQRQEQKKLEQQKQEQLEQEKKKALAVEQQKKLEEEKKQKELEEQQRKEAEEKKRLEEEQRKKAEAERKRKEAEAEQKRKEEELRKLEEEMAAMDNEFFEAQRDTVRRGQIMSEVEKLTALITAKIKRNWYPPKTAGACSIKISMGPGGVVLQTEALGGDYDYCETGKTAITRSSPLPASDDPEVMNELREMTIVFDPSFKD
ncbi:MAG TPA: cell envelope integrity protein TolA [Kangiella sp.]